MRPPTRSPGRNLCEQQGHVLALRFCFKACSSYATSRMLVQFVRISNNCPPCCLGLVVAGLDNGNGIIIASVEIELEIGAQTFSFISVGHRPPFVVLILFIAPFRPFSDNSNSNRCKTSGWKIIGQTKWPNPNKLNSHG